MTRVDLTTKDFLCRTKHIENRRHKFINPKYMVTNWPDYNVALRRRGDITIWFTEEAITGWRPAKTGVRGRPQEYSDVAIETSLWVACVRQRTDNRRVRPQSERR